MVYTGSVLPKMLPINKYCFIRYRYNRYLDAWLGELNGLADVHIELSSSIIITRRAIESDYDYFSILSESVRSTEEETH